MWPQSEGLILNWHLIRLERDMFSCEKYLVTMAMKRGDQVALLHGNLPQYHGEEKDIESLLSSLGLTVSTAIYYKVLGVRGPSLNVRVSASVNIFIPNPNISWINEGEINLDGKDL